VPNVLVAEVILDRTGIVAITGKLIAGTVSQHVRVRVNRFQSLILKNTAAGVRAVTLITPFQFEM
jgi:hypothetical protein